MGTDQPGLVHAVSAALAAAGASIESLTTDTLEAPMSGGTLFSAYATVVLPDSVDTAAVRAELERLAGNLMVDIDLSE